MRTYPDTVILEDGSSIEVNFGGDGWIDDGADGMVKTPPLRVGDTVKSWINKTAAGEGSYLDDVYPDEEQKCAIVIKDSMLVTAVPLEQESFQSWEELEVILEKLAMKYDVVETPITAWPDEAWAAKAKYQEQRKREKKAREAWILSLPKEEQEKARCALNDYTRWAMKQPSFARIIFGLEAAPPVFFDARQEYREKMRCRTNQPAE